MYETEFRLRQFTNQKRPAYGCWPFLIVWLMSFSAWSESDLPELNSGDLNTSQQSYYFYSGQDYGSESQFGPLNVFLNIGFVVPGRIATTPKLGDIRYQKGWDHVEDALSHQEETFDESGGFGRSLEKEFIPFAHPSGAWLPNYALHFLGEGMVSRKLEEYFRYNGMEGRYLPKIMAASTVFLSQMTNEVVEYELPWEQRLDPVADFYFNIAGIIAFSFDGFAQWFASDTVDYYYWPGQVVIDANDGAIFNQGENYYFRYGENGWKFAMMMGMPWNGGGVSIPMDDLELDHLTIMLGSDVIIPKDSFDPELSGFERGQDFNASDVAGEYLAALQFFWDRKGSLLASSSLSFSPTWQWSVNLYPTPLQSLGVGLGGYATLSEEGANTIGVTFDFTPVVLGRRY